MQVLLLYFHVHTYVNTYIGRLLTDRHRAVEFGSHTSESCHYSFHALVSYCQPSESVLHQNEE